MRPVRVTTPGAAPQLPLRMVAAGTGPIVGITLWVIGEGRYEPQNFATFTIGADELVWDWTSQSSNFTTLREQKQNAANHRIWENESSLAFAPQQVENVIRSGGIYFGNGGGPQAGGSDPSSDYLPVTDANGKVTETADQVREADLHTLFAGMDPGSTRITRLRSDLEHAALDKDLSLQAAADQAVLSNVRVASKEANQPPCPVYEGCDVVGTAPRDQAAAETARNNGQFIGSGSCASAPRTPGGALAMSALAGMVGLAAIRSRRARRSRRD
jgi:hypothetical protein